MLKREKKPKPWEEEAEPYILPDADQEDPTNTLAPANSLSPLVGSEDPLEDTMLPAEVWEGAIAKPRKKRSTKKIIFFIILLLVVVLLVIRFISDALKGPNPTYAEFQTVERGTIQQTLTSNGTIKTGDKRTIFCPATAPIVTADLKLGSVVNAGTQIFTFSTTDLERSVQTAAANQNLASLQAQQARTGSAEAQTTASNYQNSLTTMQQQREIAKTRATQAQASLDEVTARVTPLLAAKQAELESQRTKQISLLTSDAAAAAALQGNIDALAAEVASLEGELQQAATAYSATQADVDYHNGLVSQLENLRDQAEKGVLDGNGNAQLNAQSVPAKTALETAQDQLEKARAGVTAPITGVVTLLEAEAGGLANQYAPLCVIESLDKVDVLLSLSRYDLERVKVGQPATITTTGHTYTGTVTHIDSMATAQTTQSGVTNFVGATISISNPDKNITLGIDANVEVSTGEATDVITAPTTAINTDVNGSYVFVNENGIAVRKGVETGLSSDTLVEIVSGLSAGEQVLLSSQSITEGMKVSDDPIYMASMDMMTMMMG